MSLAHKLADRFKSELAAQILSAVSGIVLIVFLARFLGTSEYGLLFLVISVFGVAKLFSAFGIAKAAARYITEYNETNPAQVPNVIRISLLVNVVFITAVVLVLLFSRGWIAEFFAEEEIRWLLLFGALFIPLATLVQYSRIILQGFERIQMAAAIKIVNKGTRVVFVVLFVVVGLGVAGALLGYVVAYLLAVIVGMAAVFNRYRSIEAAPTEPGLATRIIKYNVPIAATHSAHTVEHQVDTILVGFFINPTAVAYYTLGKQINQFIEIPISALGFTLSPTYSAQKAKGDVETASAIYESALSHSLLLYFPAVAGLILVAEPLVAVLFGAEYLGASAVIQVLAFFALLKAVDKLTAQGLDYLGRARERATAKIATAVLNLVLNVLLIPRLGVIGAAYATVFTFGLYTAFNVYIINTELNLRVVWLLKQAGYALAVTVVMVIVVLPLIGYIDGILTLMAVILLGAVVWGIQTVLLGLIDTDILQEFFTRSDT